jgi:hypothetical protein
MFLTQDDIKRLTGYSYPKSQIGWLRNHGYSFEVDRSGKPIVLQSYLETKLNGGAKKTKRPQEPDWDAVRSL